MTEKAITERAWLRASLSGFQPSVTDRHIERDPAVFGELEGVGEQVADDLLQPLDIGEHVPRQFRIQFDAEVQAFGFGHVPECALDIILQLDEAQFAQYPP